MGGGFVSSLMKHGKLSQVTSSLEEANKNLSDLLEQLREKDISLVQFKTDSFNNFLDIYMDNFITDAIVNNTMEDCNNKINEVIGKLEDILLNLKDNYRNEFPDCDNHYTYVEEVEVICPRCNGAHLSDATECPYCGMVYDENNTPMLKLN